MANMFETFFEEHYDGTITSLGGAIADANRRPEIAEVSYLQDGVISDADKQIIADYLATEMPADLDPAA